MGDQTPVESLSDALRPVSAQLGVVDAEEKSVPEIDLNLPVGRRLARELGQYVCNFGIFVQGRRVVTVNDEGETQEMKPERFGSWCEKFVITYKWINGAVKEITMAETLAKKILAADQFRETLRPLNGVNRVRMPVIRDTGKIELLKEGYDEATGIYTIDSVKFQKDLTRDEGRNILERYLKAFPWGDLTEQGVYNNRSASVQIAAMLGTFCRSMFPPGTKRPMITYLANQPGTGKSLLGVMALAPVFGEVATTTKPRDDEKFSVVLDTVAQSFSPYMFIDDIGGGIFSNALNRFLTSARHTGRLFHSNSEMFLVPAVTQVFTTGNGIELTPDLQRRALVVDLFLAGDVRGRDFDVRITESSLASGSVRAELLSAMWALVRNWDGKHADNPLESFEDWTGKIGSMVKSAGFADPLAAPDLPDGGDKQGASWKRFLTMLAGQEILPGETERGFTVDECLEFAEKLVDEDYFAMEDLVGSAKDKGVAFGKRIGKWKGRHIQDTKGRTVEFGARRQAKGRFYECKVIAEAADPF